MKRSICIVTWFGTENYGSNLQAIAFAQSLNELGYEPYFITHFKVKSFLLKNPMLLYARVLNRINQKKGKAFFSPVPYNLSSERLLRLERFKKDHYKTKSYYSMKEWKKDIDNHIIFACGSDILWNPAIGYPAIYFLDVAYYAGLSRFAYGSSVGALELPKKYYKAYRRYLGSMKAVGVREEVVAEMFEPILGFKPTKVVDPSLLRTAEQWDAFAEKAELSVNVEKDFILCYFVMNDHRYWEYVKKVKEATGLQIVVLPMHKQDEEQGYDTVLDGTTYEFLWLIKNATFICTDSFHACVVSMIYHKEFYLLRRARKSEDAKYDDFLGRYHLDDRSVLDESKFVRKEQIDYRYADQKLEEDRKFSLDFLKSALEKC